MSDLSLDVRIAPAGTIALSPMLVAYARDISSRALAGAKPPTWVSVALAMASIPPTPDDPIYIPITPDLLEEARRADAVGGHDWAREALLSAEDKNEMFLMPRSFLDEYAALLASSQMKSIPRILRLQALQVMIDTRRKERAAGAEGIGLRPFAGAIRGGDWIPIEERLPTPQDANTAGDVLWLRSGIEMLGRVRNTAPVDATHWRSAHGC